MNIENMFDFIKAISGEIALNIQNTAKSVVGKENNSSASWSHTLGHFRNLTPFFSQITQFVTTIPVKVFNLARRIRELDPISHTGNLIRNLGDMSSIAAKTITQIETWSKAREVIGQSLVPFMNFAKDKCSFVHITALKVRNSVTLRQLRELTDPVQAEVTDKIPPFSRGEKIIRQYHVQGENFGTESVIRNETVAATIDFHVKQGRYLRANRHKIANADSLIDYHQKAAFNAVLKIQGISDYKNNSWIDSNYFRRLLPNHSGMTFEEIAKLFVSAPVNMRYHSIELDGTGKKAGFYRLGVITDPTNGWTNLKELKEMATGSEVSKRKKLERLAELNEANKTGDYKVKQATDFAANQLLDLSTTIEHRRKILQAQMIQLVVAQVDKNASSIHELESGSQFNMVHLGLLNPRTCTLNFNGWMHNENNQILDMHEIFKEFRGKELIFDGKGPYIDAEGNIHLPQNGPDWPQRIRLNPIFFNTTVQGHTKNDGIQVEINREAIKDINSILSENRSLPHSTHQQFRAIVEKLEQGRSNYALAEMLSSTMIEANLAFSTGCMSAKDRTGLVAGLIIHNFLSRDLDESYKARSARFRKKIKALFANKILDTTSPAARVVMDNTGEKVLKCSPIIFPRISQLRRGRYAFKQIRLNI